MAPIEFEISRINGEVIASNTVPEQLDEYPIGDSSFRVVDIIPGKRNGKQTIKAVRISVAPPFSDGKTQRFSLNGRPSETVPPEAENVLVGGRYKARLRVTK